jgi:endonuclease/exonuclease/phosphatase family metal-dependent hydrolase
VLIRSWNLYHGNVVPLERRAYLHEMIRLATADEPDILCVQEVPAWALGEFTLGDLAARPGLGPIPITARIGRVLTDTHHGVLRSAFSGQGNALQVSARLRVLEHGVLTLNTRRFRDAQARTLGLDALARRAWARERRIVQAVRVSDPGGRTFAIANMHCTSYAPDERLPDQELLRAAWFASSFARPEDVLVLAGDFNVTAARSRTLRDLAGAEWGFSAAGPGIDHILVRGAAVGTLRRWPDSQRTHGTRVLSDHAPVELEVLEQ